MLIPNLIGIALICYGVLVLISQDADKLHYSATCKGRLIATRKLKSLNPDDEIPQLSHKFKYEVEGRKFEGWHTQGMSDYNEYIIGRTYQLRYRTDNPNDFTVYLKPETKLYWILTIIGGLLIVILTLTGVLRV